MAGRGGQRDAEGDGFEEFRLLDIDEGGGGGGGAPASAAAGGPLGAGGETAAAGRMSGLGGGDDGLSADAAPPSDQFPRAAFSALNVFISCSALAVAKQIVNPANYGQSDAAAKEASERLPGWFASQYRSRRLAADLTRNVFKDTCVLMGASATWYGVQAGMQAVRGKEDAANVCVAGGLSAALLGALFFEPVKLPRVGLWGAVGSVAGYLGYKEQQALRAALLERQQALEQKHMHKGPDEVHPRLNTQLLKRLLDLEHQEKVGELKARLERSGVNVDGGARGGAGRGAPAAPSAAAPPADEQEAWQSLMSSAPWLVGDEGPQQQQQQQPEQGSRGKFG